MPWWTASATRADGFARSYSTRGWNPTSGAYLQGHQLSLDPGRLEQLTLRLATELRKANARGYEVAPAVRCEPAACDAARDGSRVPDLIVVSYQEIPNDLLMEPVAVIRPEEVKSGGPSAVGAMFEQPRRAGA